MSARLAGMALRGLSLAQIRHVAPVRRRGAPPRTARIYGDVEREFGVLAPPVALHAAAPDVLAASWLLVRETLLVAGHAPRAVKEAVAAAVSVANACPYCVTMHGSMLHGLVRGEVAAAVEEGRLASIDHPGVRASAAWAGRAAAGPPEPSADVPAAQVPELLGVAVLLHYLNRMVTLFLGETPMPPWAPRGMLRLVTPTLNWLMRAAARRRCPPGAALELLPAAPLPADLSWAAADPRIGDAYARASAAIELGGERSVPPSVRALLRAELVAWDGRPRGVSRAWTSDAVTGLPAGDRAAGQLALLTAMAPYQVLDSDIHAAREALGPAGTGRALVELAAWASLAAARRAGGLLAAERPA